MGLATGHRCKRQIENLRVRYASGSRCCVAIVSGTCRTGAHRAAARGFGPCCGNRLWMEGGFAGVGISAVSGQRPCTCGCGLGCPSVHRGGARGLDTWRVAFSQADIGSGSNRVARRVSGADRYACFSYPSYAHDVGRYDVMDGPATGVVVICARLLHRRYACTRCSGRVVVLVRAIGFGHAWDRRVRWVDQLVAEGLHGMAAGFCPRGVGVDVRLIGARNAVFGCLVQPAPFRCSACEHRYRAAVRSGMRSWHHRGGRMRIVAVA